MFTLIFCISSSISGMKGKIITPICRDQIIEEKKRRETIIKKQIIKRAYTITKNGHERYVTKSKNLNNDIELKELAIDHNNINQLLKKENSFFNNNNYDNQYDNQIPQEFFNDSLTTPYQLCNENLITISDKKTKNLPGDLHDDSQGKSFNNEKTVQKNGDDHKNANNTPLTITIEKNEKTKNGIGYTKYEINKRLKKFNKDLDNVPLFAYLLPYTNKPTDNNELLYLQNGLKNLKEFLTKEVKEHINAGIDILQWNEPLVEEQLTNRFLNNTITPKTPKPFIGYKRAIQSKEEESKKLSLFTWCLLYEDAVNNHTTSNFWIDMSGVSKVLSEDNYKSNGRYKKHTATLRQLLDDKSKNTRTDHNDSNHQKKKKSPDEKLDHARKVLAALDQIKSDAVKYNGSFLDRIVNTVGTILNTTLYSLKSKN